MAPPAKVRSFGIALNLRDAARDNLIGLLMHVICTYVYIYIYIYRRGGCAACILATHYFQWFCMFGVVVCGFLCELLARFVRVRACYCFQLQHPRSM